VLCRPFEISVEGENKIGIRVFLKPKHCVGRWGASSSPLSCVHRRSLERMGLYFHSPMCLDGVHKDKFAFLHTTRFWKLILSVYFAILYW